MILADSTACRNIDIDVSSSQLFDQCYFMKFYLWPLPMAQWLRHWISQPADLRYLLHHPDKIAVKQPSSCLRFKISSLFVRNSNAYFISSILWWWQDIVTFVVEHTLHVKSWWQFDIAILFEMYAFDTLGAFIPSASAGALLVVID